MSEPQVQPQNEKPTLSILLKEGIAVAKKIRPILVDIADACERLQGEKPEHCNGIDEVIQELDNWIERVVEYAISQLDFSNTRYRGYNSYKRSYKRGGTWKAKTPRGYM